MGTSISGHLEGNRTHRQATPHTLHKFSAPKLSKIKGSLNVGMNTCLESISFPALETVEGNVRIIGPPDVPDDMEIEMLNLGRVNGFQVLGHGPYCRDWRATRNENSLWETVFWCGGKEKWIVDEEEHKLLEEGKLSGERLAFK
jgi:hypothetical protein